MNRRERLMATLRGEPVDRPAVCFYEINGIDQNPDDPDRFNIYSHPSWRPLLELAREKSDLILLRTASVKSSQPDPLAELRHTETYHEGETRFIRETIRAGKRILTALYRRDPDIDTHWVVEHLIKDTDDLRAYLELPEPADGEPRTEAVLEAERKVGDSGIVMLNIQDPVCSASLFKMEDYLVIAMTEPELFRRLLDRYARRLFPLTEAVARALPGRLWRIFGPEYASPPYLPPRLFREYVTAYDREMVASIHRYDGFARLHSHGNLRDILDDLVATGCMGLDPVEPPPQGDVSLRYVRERYGRQLVLFGNLEASDLENLPREEFAAKVRRALEEGTVGQGRGFVLMPSACPYGRVLTARAMRNYETMIEIAAP